MSSLEDVRRILHEVYKQAGKTEYPMRNCFKKQRNGDILIEYSCAKEGGHKIGQKIKELWGKK